MSGVDPYACGRCGGQPYLAVHREMYMRGPGDWHMWQPPSRSVEAATGGQESGGAPATGVASVDTLRETATLTRLRDATRRRDVAAHEVATEMTRAFAEGYSPAEIDAAMAVRWPGVPS